MSQYADEGTVAHALAAMCLTEDRPAAAYVGRIIECENYEHAALSPSAAHRWMRCAGSYALESRQDFTPRKFSMEVTEEMAEAVQVYLDNLSKYRRKPNDGNWHRAPELLIEQRLPVGHITGEEGATGSGDGVILDFEEAEIQCHELKFGKGVLVDATENEQLQLYGLGALELFADFAPEGGWKRFRGVIHQPRVSERPSEWSCSIEDLKAFGFKARAAASVAESAKKILIEDRKRFEEQYLEPGEKQCKFCNAKAQCPRAQQLVTETVLAEFVDLDSPKPIAKKPDVVAIPADNVKLARLLDLVPVVEDWCKAIAAHAEAELLAGRPVPGYKLVQGRRGARAWSDEAEAEKVMKSFRLKQGEMYEFKLISPTQAEKVLKDQPKRWAKLAPLITQADGKPTVVPESDKRPALEVKPVIDEFAALPALAEEEGIV